MDLFDGDGKPVVYEPPEEGVVDRAGSLFIQDTELFKGAVLNMAPRTFNSFTKRIVAENWPDLKHDILKGSRPLDDGPIKDTGSAMSLMLKAKEGRWINRYSDSRPYKAHISQLRKTHRFLCFVLYWKDCMEVFRIARSELSLHPQYKPFQHSGNDDRQQVALTHEGMEELREMADGIWERDYDRLVTFKGIC